MKHLRLLLLGVFTLSLVAANAQSLRIEKRKHLKGYNIEYSRGEKSAEDFKISDGKRLSAADVASLDQPKFTMEEPTVMVRPVVESAPEIASATASQTQSKVVANASSSNKVAKRSNFFRHGAGLVLKHRLNVLNEKAHKIIPAAKLAGPAEIFGYIGFVFGILSVIALFVPGSAIALGIVGLIFSLLGQDGGAANFAYWGLILSIIGLALGLLFLILFYAR